MRRLAVWWAVAIAAVVVTAGAAGGSRAYDQAVATIQTVAGNGVDGSDGDGGPATAAAINHPRGIAFLADGSFVFAQPFVPMVRRVTPDGRISTLVGDGTHGYSGDGGPAPSARVALAHGVAALPDGGFAIADMINNRIRRVWPSGIITTVAGTGIQGYSGDGGAATAAAINLPRGVAARPDGELLIADSSNHRVRRVTAAGVITTVAGNGQRGFSGDGGPATTAQLNRPFSVAPLPDGGFLIADLDNNRIRRVDSRGIVTTVAGTGAATFSGDGGPATAAAIYQPHAVAALPDGGFLIADTYNHRVRRVGPDGRISTVAGTGTEGFFGDGGPATGAMLSLPKALALLPDLSGFLVGDSANNRIRLVRLDLRPPLVLRISDRTVATTRGRSARLRYTLSEQAAARLEVVRHGSVVLGVRQSGRAGANVLRFGASLAAGTYGLRLGATASGARTASAGGSLVVKQRRR